MGSGSKAKYFMTSLNFPHHEQGKSFMGKSIQPVEKVLSSHGEERRCDEAISKAIEIIKGEIASLRSQRRS